MKLVTLLASTAVVAMAATSVSAQTVTETRYVNPANPGNVGVIADDLSATFSVSGTVATSCVLGNGDAVLRDVDFGTIGIYGDGANGVASAFKMVGTSWGNSATNLAGCNTANRLTIAKGNGVAGLVNADAQAAGYDDNDFQANIPYVLTAVYHAGRVGQIGRLPNQGKFTVRVSEPSDSRENNAWRGGLGIKVEIPVAAKALVSGTYSDTVTVQIEAI